jgi:hypothetical protein
MDILRPASISAALALALALPVSGQQPAAPWAHVEYVEGAASLEREGNAEALSAGMPLTDGDRLRTGDGRVEIRYENGSTLYIDQSSTLDILAADSLRLVAGDVTFDIIGNRPYLIPLYRVDTPAASVTIDAPGEYRVMATSGAAAPGAPSEPPRTTTQVVRGTANLTSDTGGMTVRTGEQSTVAAGELPGFPVRFNSARWDLFRQWVELRRSGRGVLSVSRQYLPPVIESYAGTLDRYGTWTRDAQFGVVWYPTIGGGWRPYHSGRWAWVAPFGWTWVGAEAWAWPTLHYGQWCLSANGSWFWIPGSSWGTAAPIVAGLQGAEFVHGAPRTFARGARGHVRGRSIRDAGGVLSQSPYAAPGATPSLQHDSLARRPLSPMSQSPTGLPFPTTGLPPLRQGIAPSVPSVGVTPHMRLGTAWTGRSTHQQRVSPRTGAPQSEAPVALPRTLGWGAAPMTAPRTTPPTAPPATGARPQFGAWGSIAPSAAPPR